jgi:triacylglycerol esterase/lipase EstA (alpha/beta hydrolase family)
MLVSLFALALKAALAAVIITYVLRLYEWRNLPEAERPADEERLAPWLAGTLALFWEFVTTVGVILLYPVGWFMTDRHKEHRPGSRPVLLVPGFLGNEAAFLWLKHYLERRGHTVFTVDLGPSRAGLKHFAALIADRVDEILVQTGEPKADLVCHGLGGLAARLYLAGGGAARVATCVTVATPHRGTKLAVLLRGRAAREMHPSSPLVAELLGAPISGVKAVNIYSTFDNWVLPPVQAILPGAENHVLHYLGHTGLFFSEQVGSLCARALAAPEAAKPAATYSTEFPNG